VTTSRSAAPARLLASLVAAALLAGACTGSATGDGGDDAAEDIGRDLEFEGPEEGALVNAAELERLSFAVTATSEDERLDDLRLLLDGEDVTADAEVQGATITYVPGPIPDGERTVVVAESPPADGTDGEEAEDEAASPANRRRCTPGGSRSRPNPRPSS
jgi:hypothetical protein